MRRSRNSMQRLHSVFFTLLCGVLCTYNAAAELVEVSGDRVNLRALPRLENSEVLTQLSRGEKLTLHGALSDPWVAVSVPERANVWIHADLVKDGVVIKRAKLRAGGNLNYNSIGILEPGEKVSVRGKVGDWIKIAPPQVPAISGYITNIYVRAAGAAPVANPAPHPAAVPAAQPTPAVKPAAPQPKPAIAAEPKPAVNATPKPVVTTGVGPKPAVPAGGGRRTLLKRQPVSLVGPAKIPSSRLRADAAQANPGTFSGILASAPVFAENPTRYRLIAFDARNKPFTVCYVYGNNEQLASFKGEALTVTGAVYWFSCTQAPTIFAQDILRGGKERR